MLAVIAGYFFVVRRMPSESPEPVEPVDWQAVGEDALTAERAEKLRRATRARDALFAELSAKLREALATGDAATAIPVCRDEAPRIAARVSSEHGLSIGRTSLRLRNPTNQPPAWAAAHVRSAAELPAYFAGPAGRLGVLLPIRVQPACLVCHGSIEHLAPGVREALARHYIEDRATGFAEGDLRGWFWIEVPG